MTSRKTQRIKEEILKIWIIIMIVMVVGYVGHMDSQDDTAKKNPYIYIK